jgi:hypothetical protein
MACYTIKEARDLWDYAKETYLKQPRPYATKAQIKAGLDAGGYPDFKELTQKLSDDIWKATGGKRRIVPEEVARILNTPKTATKVRKNLLLTDRNRMQMLHQAANFVTGTERSPLMKFVTGVYHAPYAAKIAYHSAALHGTHAWPYALDPLMWKAVGKTWVESWKSMSPSNARAIGQGIMLSPKFDEEITSGLAADPRKIYDDVQQKAGFWGKLGQLGSNSFLGLKHLRQIAWEFHESRVPDYLKTDEMRLRISNHVNHMTGAPGREAARALSGNIGKTFRAIAFAPSLDVARVMRPVDLIHSGGIGFQEAMNKAPMIGDQLRKVWGQASPEARWMARENMKQWARIAAVGGSILAMNDLALQYLFGNNERINWDDIEGPDLLAPKAPDGSILQATGGEVPMIRAIARSVRHPSQAPMVMGNYMMGKLNPFLSTGATLAKGWGFGGTDVPAPFGQKEATLGNWAEFLLSELGPISTEEGVHEFAQQMDDQNGIGLDLNTRLLRAILKSALVIVPAVMGTHYYKPTTTPRSSRSGGGGIIKSQ